MRDQFDHERLDVYQVSLDFVGLANDIIDSLPRGRRTVADQLPRASISVTLNIAEGAGEFSGNEKLRFYRMARRSATECAAILEICWRLDLARQPVLQTGRELLLRIVSMLIGMAKTGMGTSSGTGRGTGTGTTGCGGI